MFGGYTSKYSFPPFALKIFSFWELRIRPLTINSDKGSTLKLNKVQKKAGLRIFCSGWLHIVEWKRCSGYIYRLPSLLSLQVTEVTMKFVVSYQLWVMGGLILVYWRMSHILFHINILRVLPTTNHRRVQDFSSEGQFKCF